MKRVRWAPPSATSNLGFIPLFCCRHAEAQGAPRNSIVLETVVTEGSIPEENTNANVSSVVSKASENYLRL